jgi:hypothetical protein
MKYLKTFESFDLKEYKLDKKTVDFIDGKITESKFIEYLNTELLGEGITDDIKSFFKDKIYNVLMSFIKKACEIGFIIFESFKSVINWILDRLSKWKKENPVLHKVIIITSITFILLIASASTAYAQTTGTPVNVNHINMAIGFLEKLQSNGWGVQLDNMKAMAYLIDLRDGSIDMPLDKFGKESIDIANASMSMARKLTDEALDTKNDSMVKLCIDAMDAGAKYVGSQYMKFAGTEQVKLFMK